jgi:hypothetical protein
MDFELDLNADGLLLIAGHASGRELLQKWAMVFKRWVQECEISTTVIKLGRFVNIGVQVRSTSTVGLTFLRRS